MARPRNLDYSRRGWKIRREVVNSIVVVLVDSIAGRRADNEARGGVPLIHSA